MDKLAEVETTEEAAEPQSMTIAESYSRLSDAQRQVYDFIRDYWNKNSGTLPTFDEIGDALYIARSHARFMVLMLAEAGLIDYRANRAGKRAGLYVLAGARVSIDDSQVVNITERAFRKPGRHWKKHRGNHDQDADRT